MVFDSRAGRYERHELPPPTLGPRDLLVAVRAAGLNRADEARREGRYGQPALEGERPPIAGLEAAGVVIEVGPAVTRHAPGDRVMGMCSGGFAQSVTIDERVALTVPPTLAWATAAAAPVGLMTGYDAIVRAAALRPGESVLVSAAASGVGLLALQIARLREAAPILATVTATDKAEVVAAAGAEVVIDAGREDLGQIVALHTTGGVDVIIDHVGGSSLGAGLDSLAVGGRLVSVGRLAATQATIDLDLLARRNLRLLGRSFRSRSLAEIAMIADGVAAELLPAVASGDLRPVVARTFPLAEAEAAHRFMLEGNRVGKVVLEVGDE
jgi:NADPH:quinone reductase-like Zn-dependent oxidoreductase